MLFLVDSFGESFTKNSCVLNDLKVEIFNLGASVYGA